MEIHEKTMTFRSWCELNGRRWVGAKTFEEFQKNANDYKAYVNKIASKQTGGLK